MQPAPAWPSRQRARNGGAANPCNPRNSYLRGPKDAKAIVSSMQHNCIRRGRTTAAPQLPTLETETRHNPGHAHCTSPPWTLSNSLRLSDKSLRNGKIWPRKNSHLHRGMRQSSNRWGKSLLANPSPTSRITPPAPTQTPTAARSAALRTGSRQRWRMTFVVFMGVSSTAYTPSPGTLVFTSGGRIVETLIV